MGKGSVPELAFQALTDRRKQLPMFFIKYSSQSS